MVFYLCFTSTVFIQIYIYIYNLKCSFKVSLDLLLAMFCWHLKANLKIDYTCIMTDDEINTYCCFNFIGTIFECPFFLFYDKRICVLMQFIVSANIWCSFVMVHKFYVQFLYLFLPCNFLYFTLTQSFN